MWDTPQCRSNTAPVLTSQRKVKYKCMKCMKSADCTCKSLGAAMSPAYMPGKLNMKAQVGHATVQKQHSFSRQRSARKDLNAFNACKVLAEL